MKVLIFSKLNFNNFMQYNGITDDNVETKDMLIVSINNVKDTSSYFEKEHENVKIMHFGDYSEEFVLRVIHEYLTGRVSYEK